MGRIYAFKKKKCGVGFLMNYFIGKCGIIHQVIKKFAELIFKGVGSVIAFSNIINNLLCRRLMTEENKGGKYNEKDFHEHLSQNSSFTHFIITVSQCNNLKAV